VEKDRRDAILREQIRLVVEQLPTMQIASVVVALGLAVTVRNRVSPGNILAWVLLVSGIAAGRLLLYRRFVKVRSASFVGATWEKIYLVLALASGIVWGLSAFLLLPVSEPGLVAFFLLVIASLSAATTVSHSGLKYGSSAWVAPAMLLYVLRLFMHGGEIERTTGLLAILYMLTILHYSLKHHRTITSSIALRFENV